MLLRLELRYRQIFLFALLFLALWRALIATQVGLGVDEAHYVLYGRHVDLSYFDHPPLVGWIHWLFQQVPIKSDFLARLPAILISALTSVLALRFLLRQGFTQAASVFSVIILNLTPLFNGMSLMLLPDSPLMPLIFLLIEATENTVRHKSIKSWLILGLILGLCGLSKYTAVLFVPALVIYFLREGRWREILTLRFCLGVLVSVVVVSPILIWNLRNHFVSFSYQSDHVLSFQNFSFKNFLQTWGGQLIIWGISPFVLAIMALGRLKTFRQNELVFWLGWAFLGFFTVISFFQTLLPHWTLVLFVLMIPWAAATAWDDCAKNKLKFRMSFVLVLPVLLSLPLMLELGFKVFPSQWTAAGYHDVVQWGEVMKEASLLSQAGLPASAPSGVAVFNWTLGSRAMYYAPPGFDVFVLDGKNHQFSVWNAQPPEGRNLMIAIEEEKITETLSQISCDQVEKVGHRKGYIRGALVHEFSYFRCLNYRGLKL